MASVTEVTTLCKQGQTKKAYELSKADMEQQVPWAQREMGWALYYLMKEDTDSNNYQSLVSHLEEFCSLDQLSTTEDNMIFDKVLFKLAGFVKTHIPPTDIDSPTKLSTIFSMLHKFSFGPSKGYSFLLQIFIKCDNWQEMADFIDWWNLDKLTEEDYTPFKMDNGKTLMSVAEQAFIAKSKALLRLNDQERVRVFLPQLDGLMTLHPEMTYPGYYYGKLLLSLGSTVEEELRVLIPFVRRKATEFWVWQLLSDVFVGIPEKQLACLFRALHCNTQEIFLVKVRIKLARLFIQQRQYNLAKYQIDRLTHCFLSHGLHLPFEVQCWIHEPWFSTAISDSRAPIDFLSITDELLCEGTEEAIAIVTHFDANTQKATLIYGMQKRMVQKLRIKVRTGDILKINYILEPDGRYRLLSSTLASFSNNIEQAKAVEGIVRKRYDKEFAFLKTDERDYFIAPNVVNRYKLSDNEPVCSVVVYDYNRKKETWDWTCVTIDRKIKII